MSRQKSELWMLLDSNITPEELDLFVSDALEPKRAAEIAKMAHSSSLLRDMIAETRSELESIPAPAGPDEAWLRRALEKYSPTELEEILIVGVVTADLFKIALEEAKSRNFPEDVVARIETKLRRRVFRQLVEAAQTNVAEKLKEMRALVAGVFSPVRYTGPVFAAGYASTQEELVPIRSDTEPGTNPFEVYADPNIKKIGFTKAGENLIQINVYPKPVSHSRTLHVLIPGTESGEIRQEVKGSADSIKVSTAWPVTSMKEVQVYIWLSDLPVEDEASR